MMQKSSSLMPRKFIEDFFAEITEWFPTKNYKIQPRGDIDHLIQKFELTEDNIKVLMNVILLNKNYLKDYDIDEYNPENRTVCAVFIKLCVEGFLQRRVGISDSIVIDLLFNEFLRTLSFPQIDLTLGKIVVD